MSAGLTFRGSRWRLKPRATSSTERGSRVQGLLLELTHYDAQRHAPAVRSPAACRAPGRRTHMAKASVLTVARRFKSATGHGIRHGGSRRTAGQQLT